MFLSEIWPKMIISDTNSGIAMWCVLITISNKSSLSATFNSYISMFTSSHPKAFLTDEWDAKFHYCLFFFLHIIRQISIFCLLIYIIASFSPKILQFNHIVYHSPTWIPSHSHAPTWRRESLQQSWELRDTTQFMVNKGWMLQNSSAAKERNEGHQKEGNAITTQVWDGQLAISTHRPGICRIPTAS